MSARAGAPRGGARLADWLSLLALVLAWGTAFGASQVALRSIAPLAVAAGRICVAAVALGAALWALGSALPRSRRSWAYLALLAVLGNALPFSLISWGQEQVASSLTGIWMATNPLLTFALAHFFIPGEALTRRRALGLALGFAGVCLLLAPGARGGLGASGALRQCAILAGAFSYAVNTILIRRLAPAEPRVAALCVLLLAGALTAPPALAAQAHAPVSPSWASLLAVLWLGLVPTAVATVLYFRVIRSAGPSFLSLVNYAVPLVAVACGALFFGERLEPHAGAGLLLILGSLALAQRRRDAAPGPPTR